MLLKRDTKFHSSKPCSTVIGEFLTFGFRAKKKVHHNKMTVMQYSHIFHFIIGISEHEPKPILNTFHTCLFDVVSASLELFGVCQS